MKDEIKNSTGDMPEASGEKVGEELIELLDETIECNVEAPVKPKRQYVWKGEKRRQRSEEHNSKIAEGLRGRNLSEEHRHNIAEAMIGNDNFHK